MNFLGLCAASVPTGPVAGDAAAAALPTSLMIVCRPGDECLALAIARAYEQARGELAAPPMAKLCNDDAAHDSAPAGA